jgi:hypothetical protein
MRLPPKLAGLLALVALALAAAPAAAAKPHGGFESCGDIAQLFTHDIQVRQVGCGLAKRVVGRYDRTLVKDLQHNWSLTILGFDCDLVRKHYYGEAYRCASGDRLIRFRRGPN